MATHKTQKRWGHAVTLGGLFVVCNYCTDWSSMKIDTGDLVGGEILGVQSYGWVGTRIRRAQTVWLRRICRNAGIPNPDQYHSLFNHIGTLLRIIEGRWYVGEALSRGNVMTPLAAYNKELARKKCKVWVMRPINASINMMGEAMANWYIYVKNAKYDYWAYPRLLWKCLVGDWWSKECGDPWKFICSEGPKEAYAPRNGDTPQVDFLQDDWPTPLHYEMRCGLNPQKPGKQITLELLAQYS